MGYFELAFEHMYLYIIGLNNTTPRTILGVYIFEYKL
jgi:hypothetical protein